MDFHKIKLSGAIGWDITNAIVDEELSRANGKDVEVTISSEGGSVFAGVDIYNSFRAYKRNFPNAQMILHIGAMAASMGSYNSANEAFDLVIVEDNTSWMIHNPLMGVIGDYQEMKKATNFLERLSSLMSKAYEKRSKKENKEIRKMMDNETWLFGQEIVDAGFADEVIKTDGSLDRDSSIAAADLKFRSVMAKVKEQSITDDDFSRVAAMFDTQVQKQKQELQQEINMQNPATSGDNNNQEEVNMTPEELKKANPDTFAVIEMAGVDKGKAEMIANNKAIMDFKNKPEYKGLTFIQARCDEAMINGEKFDDLKMSVMALMLDPKNQAEIESPGNINGGSSTTMSGEQSKITYTEAYFG